MTQTLEYLIAVVEGETSDPTLDPQATALAAQLLELEREERQVSDLRRKLHDRLASFPNPTTQEREREISAYRRELHGRIDALRVDLELLGWPRTNPL